MNHLDGQGLRARLSFAAPELGLTFVFAMTNSWFLYFLVEVVGLTPLLAGVAFAIGRVGDAVFDPLVGSLSDRHAATQGRKILPMRALLPAVVGNDQSALSSSVVGDWSGMIVAASILLIAAFVPFFLFVVEPARPSRRQKQGAFWSTAAGMMSDAVCRSALLVFVWACIVVFGTQAGLPFFFEQRLKLDPGEQAQCMVYVFGAAFCSFPVWAWISGRIGTRASLMLGLAPMLVFFTMAATLEEGLSPALIAACIIAGLGIAPLNIFPWAMVPGAVERWCRISRRSEEGRATAVFTFAFKASGAVAVFSVACALEVLERSGASSGGRATSAALLGVPTAAILGLAATMVASRRRHLPG